MSQKPPVGKSKKKRSASSTRWLQRQARDPYVLKSKKEGYRSRAAYKLLELDDKFHFLKPGKHLVDLGAAPGGWLQVATQKMKPKTSGSQLIGVDLLAIDPIENVTFIQGDFTSDEIYQKLIQLCPEKIDIILSDMSPSTTGHGATDHIRIMSLCEMAWDFAKNYLSTGGTFVMKVFQGGAMASLLAELKPCFDQVKHFKPPASRKESSELYLVATGFKVGR